MGGLIGTVSLIKDGLYPKGKGNIRVYGSLTAKILKFKFERGAQTSFIIKTGSLLSGFIAAVILDITGGNESGYPRNLFTKLICGTDGITSCIAYADTDYNYIEIETTDLSYGNSYILSSSESILDLQVISTSEYNPSFHRNKIDGVKQ